MKDKNPSGSLKDNKESMNRLKTRKTLRVFLKIMDVKEETGPNTSITLTSDIMSDRVCRECRRLSWLCSCRRKKRIKIESESVLEDRFWTHY